MTERIGAIVLAGGRSSRFGRDKLAEPIDGRPLLHHAIAAVQSVAGDVVVVVAPGQDPALPEGVRLVHDAAAFEGPLAGLAAGLEALDPDIDRVVVVAGDMPTLEPAVLKRLVAMLGPSVDLALLGGRDAELVVGDDVPPALERGGDEALHRLLVLGHLGRDHDAVAVAGRHVGDAALGRARAAADGRPPGYGARGRPGIPRRRGTAPPRAIQRAAHIGHRGGDLAAGRSVWRYPARYRYPGGPRAWYGPTVLGGLLGREVDPPVVCVARVVR